jgi:hypothetical protein
MLKGLRCLVATYALIAVSPAGARADMTPSWLLPPPRVIGSAAEPNQEQRGYGFGHFDRARLFAGSPTAPSSHRLELIGHEGVLRASDSYAVEINPRARSLIDFRVRW